MALFYFFLVLLAAIGDFAGDFAGDEGVGFDGPGFSASFTLFDDFSAAFDVDGIGSGFVGVFFGFSTFKKKFQIFVKYAKFYEKFKTV